MTVLLVAGPIILATAILGLTVGVLQAATQIQDQTIPSAVKLITVLLLLIFLGVWMFTRVKVFTEKVFGRSFTMVINQRETVLTARNRPVSTNIKFTGGNPAPLPSFYTKTSGGTMVNNSNQNFVPPPPTFTSYALPTDQSTFPTEPVPKQIASDKTIKNELVSAPTKPVNIIKNIKKRKKPIFNKVILTKPIPVVIKPKLPANNNINIVKGIEKEDADRLPPLNSASANWW